MTEPSTEHKHLCMMFSDIVGYSKMMADNPAITLKLLEAYRDIFTQNFAKHEGTLVEYVGDGIFAYFPTSQQAVYAAIDIQQDLYRFSLSQHSDEPPLQARIGLNDGQIMVRDGALFGDEVNIAARLEPIAYPGGICVSQSVYEQIEPSSLGAPVSCLGKYKLKNIQNPRKLFLIRPQGIGLAVKKHYLVQKFKRFQDKNRLSLTAALVSIFLLGLYLIPKLMVPNYDVKYVEVMDFASPDKDKDGILNRGFSESVKSALTSYDGIYVANAGDGVSAPLRVEGSIQSTVDHLRITYSIYRKEGNVLIDGGTLDGSNQDYFILQDRLSAEISEKIAQEFGLKSLRGSFKTSTENLLAYQYYLEALVKMQGNRSHDVFDDVINLFTKALIHDPDFGNAESGLCRAYIEKYRLSKKSVWIKKAEQSCKNAVSQDPLNANGYRELGVYFRDIGNYDKAFEAFQRALEIDDSQVNTWVDLGNMFRLKGDKQEAENTFKKAIEMAPNDWKTHGELGSFYLHSGQFELSTAHYENALRIAPGNAQLLNNVGAGQYYLGNFLEAAKYFERAVEIVPLALSYSNTGTNYYFAGDFESARRMFQKAVKLDPENFRYYQYLGDSIRQTSKEESESKEMYSIAIDMAYKQLDLHKNDPQILINLALMLLSVGNDDHIDIANRAKFDYKADMNFAFAKVKYLAMNGEIEEGSEIFDYLKSVGFPEKILNIDPDLENLRR